MKDYYSLLEIEFGASEEEIRKAYRRLVLKYHPDRNDDPQAAQKFIEITEAYETLIDPQRRQEYDKEYINFLKQKALTKVQDTNSKDYYSSSQANNNYTNKKVMQSADSKQDNTVPALLILVSILSFIGIASLPYGYYTLLRIVVFVSAGILAIYDLDRKATILFIISALFAIIFNPIIPIYLDKEVWQVLDFLAGIFFLIEAFRWKHG